MRSRILGQHNSLNFSRTMLSWLGSITNNPGLPAIYRHYSSKATGDYVKIVPLKTHIEEEDIGKIRQELVATFGNDLIENKKVLQFAPEDIILSKNEGSTTIIAISRDGFKLRYGNPGIATKKGQSPSDLLTKACEVSKKFFGMIVFQKHVPFQFNLPNTQHNIIIPTTKLRKVLSLEHNSKRYSLETICPLQEDDAKRLSIEIQRRIHNDPKKQKFYEEETAIIFKPSEGLEASGTLMSFEDDEDITKTTDSHMHPGQRTLVLYTKNKASGVILNHCGPYENPNQRKDCETKLHFPKNSILVLNFPAYTHHKFYGNFECLSIHPQEGKNVIANIRNGEKLEDQKGFLEGATIFSIKNSKQGPTLEPKQQITKRQNAITSENTR